MANNTHSRCECFPAELLGSRLGNQTLGKKLISLLRKQTGFEDDITFFVLSSRTASSISHGRRAWRTSQQAQMSHVGNLWMLIPPDEWSGESVLYRVDVREGIYGDS